ncbi:putative disease resistance RPP13-like protein 1 [Senna tora]|uniref:Putative disease resistance RPP13-like protein 1 n=1 Tax=Senna tora TaxID=362788 RepID=A0A835CG90_9FABA|nr:putative disease resistance RPP13-like protein 1 [Senna tora]
MAELVGGAILQAVFGVLLERLTPDAEFLNFIRQKKLDNNLLYRLKPTLNAARAVLNDAELKQFKDPAVKEWLYDLKDAVYQVQDLMDDISTQNQVCHFSSASLKVNDRDMRIKWYNKYFVMHDLIHDLAISVAGDFFFRLEKEGEGNKISTRARHLSYFNLNFPSFNDIESFKRAKALRTILGFDYGWIPGSLGNTIMQLDLKYLRVLSFNQFHALKTVPDSIGEFIHLQYLDLCGTSIVRLPDSLCKLYNLQTLKLHFCHNLTKLPNNIHDLVNLRYLFFVDAPIKEMPRGMSKLKNLQILSKFIVGNEPETTNIGELGEMQNLMNGIEIRKLENIKNGNEACKARMMEKQHIRRLTLSWSSDDCINDSHTEKDILDNLQPHWGLEMLTITGYRGTIFPNWLGSRSYSNMTSLQLQNCNYCWMLPPLGQLPALKSLYICGFDSIVAIGEEFFKGDNCSSVIPFSYLEYLQFGNMSAWEEWHSVEREAFPKLRKLHISNCPKLTGNLPIQLVSLKSLTVSGCPLLCSFIPRCPKLEDLEIPGSQNLVLQEQVLPPSLRTLKISGNRMVESMFEAMAHSEIIHMEELGVSGCSSAISFPVLQSVTRLTIYNCKHVEFQKQQCQMSLKEISVANSCDLLTSFPIEIFPILNYLKIGGSENLISVLVSDTPLQNLQSIYIFRCENLKWLSDDSEYLLPNLKVVTIRYCPKVEPFSKGFLPSSLRELTIISCKKLLSHHTEWHLPSITSLTIREDHDIIEHFPGGTSLPPTLTTLKLEYLSSLHTLNCKGLHHLTSLQELKILGCPKLEKMEGEKLPTSLRKLLIDQCHLLEQRCRNKDQEIWPKISHIPAIRLSYEWFSLHATSHRFNSCLHIHSGLPRFVAHIEFSLGMVNDSQKFIKKMQTLSISVHQARNPKSMFLDLKTIDSIELIKDGNDGGI